MHRPGWQSAASEPLLPLQPVAVQVMVAGVMVGPYPASQVSLEVPPTLKGSECPKMRRSSQTPWPDATVGSGCVPQSPGREPVPVPAVPGVGGVVLKQWLYDAEAHVPSDPHAIVGSPPGP